jgi:hypothetical protein
MTLRSTGAHGPWERTYDTGKPAFTRHPEQMPWLRPPTG